MAAATTASHSPPEPVPDGGVELTGFEGPEKTIELDFVIGDGPAEGMRLVTRKQWDSILELASCSIMVEHKDKCIDSYVLSESSLFVMANKLVIKTCGTTTLLLLLPAVVAAAKELGLEVEWLSYTRKDFLFPQLQKYPHRSTDEEIAFLREHFPDGHAHMLGPLTRDHWFIFTADRCERDPDDLTERTLNLMMYNISPETAACFTRDGLAERDTAAAELLSACPSTPTQAEQEALCRELGDCVTRRLLLDKLLPGTTTQAWLFEPCGWSLNGGVSLGAPTPSASTPGRYTHPTDGSIAPHSPPVAPSAATTEAQDSAYWTIHVTPEEHCSYVSFETNAPLCRHRALVKALLALFRPRRFTMTLYADTGGLHLMHKSVHDDSGATLQVSPGLAYSRLDLCSTVFEGTYSVILGNYRIASQAKAGEAAEGTPQATADASLLPAAESAQMRELVAASAAVVERDLGRFKPA